METKGFKLTSGEEIVAAVHKSEPAFHVIENPVLIEWEFNHNQFPAYQFLPWAYTALLNRQQNLSVFAVATGPYDVREDVSRGYGEVVSNLVAIEEREQTQKLHQIVNLTPRRVSKRKG